MRIKFDHVAGQNSRHLPDNRHVVAKIPQLKQRAIGVNGMLAEQRQIAHRHLRRKSIGANAVERLLARQPAMDGGDAGYPLQRRPVCPDRHQFVAGNERFDPPFSSVS